MGIFCVVGAYLRSGSSASPTFIFALWFNRVIIGLAIGAPWPAAARNKALLRGAVLGLLVSFAFYSSTGFVDPVRVLSQQMVSTPVTELDSDIVQKDGWNKPDFSI